MSVPSKRDAKVGSSRVLYWIGIVQPGIVAMGMVESVLDRHPRFVVDRVGNS